MGIISVAELPSDGSFSVDEKGYQKTTRRFIVEGTLDTIELNASDAVADVFGVHHLDLHPESTTMRALTIDTKRINKDTLGWFYVEVNYDSKTTNDKDSGKDPSQDQQSVPPDQRPYLVSVDQVEHDKLLAPKDMDTVNGPDGTPGQFVVNKANTPFDPPPTIQTSNPVFTIEGYKAIAAMGPANKANFYANSVNEDDYNLPGTFGKILAGTGRCKKYGIKQVFENNDYWYKFTIQIEVKADKWNPLRVLNAGCYFIYSMSAPPQPIIVRGKPVTKPVALKDDGSGPINAGDAPNWCEFKAYLEQTWSGAGNLI